MKHLVTALVGLALVFGFLLGTVWGGCRAERNAYHNRFLEEEAAILRVLSSHPGFARIQVTEEYTGHASLTGELHWDDYGPLYQGLAKALGERRAQELMGALQMVGKPPDFTPPVPPRP